MIYVAVYGIAWVSNIYLLSKLLVRKTRSQVIFSFIIFISFLTLWATSAFIQTVLGANISSLAFQFFETISAVGFVPLPSIFLVFALLYTRNSRWLGNYAFWLLTALPTLMFLYLALATNLITVHVIENAILNPWGFDADTGQLFPYFLAWFDLMFLIALTLIAKNRNSAGKRHKTQSMIVIVGILVPLVIGSITNGLLPILGYNVFPAAIPLTTIMAALIIYAIDRYGLFEITAEDISENIIELVPDAIILIDKNLVVRFANRAAAVLGFGHRQMIGKDVRSIFGKDITKMLTKDAEPTAKIRFEFTTPEKIRKFLDFSVARIGDEAILVSITDLTDLENLTKELEQRTVEAVRANRELKNTQKALINVLEDLEEEKNSLLKERARDEAMLGNIGEGVIAVDEKQKIILANNEALDLLGFSRGKKIVGLDGSKLLKLYNKGRRPVKPQDGPIFRAIKKGEKFSSKELFYEKYDQTLLAVGMTITPITVGDKIIGAVQVFRDVTKEKEVDRAKTEFISLASHQLRTPLSAIKWFGEMLLEGDAGKLLPEQNQFMKNISVSTNRMIELVNTLLNISRIESGRIGIAPEPTNIRTLLNKELVEFQPKIKEKKINFKLSIDPRLPKATVDPQLTGEIYANLLSNAIKYTPAGGEIKVTVKGSGNEILNEIADTGYGIPVKDHGKIFSKFYRGHNIVKTDTTGTGLGLYLVKAILDSSGGKIWFTSKLNKGTTFWFTLPLKMAAKSGEITLSD